MDTAFLRTAILLGKDGMDRLSKSHVAIFGLGGVGGYCLEALARSGIGSFDLIDNDVVDVTNLNRQILAMRSTIGRLKTEVAAERVRDINPQAKINIYNIFYTEESACLFDFSQYDYVIDAVDTVAAKVSLVLHARQSGVKIISCMGMGNKLDPTAIEVGDIYSTSVCPLARAMRSMLKKAGVKSLKTVYSKELPANIDTSLSEKKPSGRPAPASCSFVPSVAGLIMAGEIIKELSNGI